MMLKTNYQKLYKSMLRIRLVEEEIAKRYSQEKMRCPVHLSIGQEAIAVGVMNNLNINDKIYSTHRCHAHYLAKGGNLKKMICELYGKVSGCCGGRGGSMHLFDDSAGIVSSLPIVGSVIPLAVGNALTFKLKKENFVSSVFFGDGAIEEGVYHESANFAKVQSLSVLFVCENNLFSVYTPLDERQPSSDLTRHASAHGIKSLKCDGNDIRKVNELAFEACEYIKKNKQPFFLQLDTYRHREHCGPNFDDNLDYRQGKEVNYWLNNDPLKIEKDRLICEKNLNEDEDLNFINSIMNEIEEAFQFAEQDAFPEPETAKNFVYEY